MVDDNFKRKSRKSADKVIKPSTKMLIKTTMISTIVSVTLFSILWITSSSAFSYYHQSLPFLSKSKVHISSFVSKTTSSFLLSKSSKLCSTTSRTTTTTGSSTTKLQQSMDSNNNNNDSTQMGLNELQTLLRNAVQKQDFIQAGELSDELYSRLWLNDGNDDIDYYHNTLQIYDEKEIKRLRRRRMSWRGLGTAPWLVDRLDNLNYTFPTTIQIHAMEAVNAILNDNDNNVMMTTTTKASTTEDNNDSDDELLLGERVKNYHNDMGIVISGTTGSGKTLGFLVPLLSTLSDSLFIRQRLRVGIEEKVSGDTDDWLERVAVVTSPMIRSNSRKQTINKNSKIAIGAALSTLGTSSTTDLKSPLALIIVPTKELGIQSAMLLYELVGGSIRKDETEIKGKSNMFHYKGPKGIRIGCVLDDQEAEFGLKLQTDVAITTPQYLTKLLLDGDIVPNKLRVIVYDEADLVLEETIPNDLKLLFEENNNNNNLDDNDNDDDDDDDDDDDEKYSKLTFLVGASVTESLGSLAVRSRILPNGKSYISTATRHSPLLQEHYDDGTIYTDADPTSFSDKSIVVGKEQPASLKELDVCLDPGLKHERCKVLGDESSLLVLTRLLREELSNYSKKVKESSSLSSTTTGQQQQQVLPPPRVVVFFPNEEIAKSSIEPLRDALWGEHKLCVLLPKTGINPLQMMEQFKKNETSVMLATANSVRGLDFPDVTHVYTTYLPVNDPREYVHLAGRVGRVGQSGSTKGNGGRVISICKGYDDINKMDILSKELNFTFVDIDVPKSETIQLEFTDDGNIKDLDSIEIEKMKRLFEDTMNLVDLVDDPNVIINDDKTTTTDPNRVVIDTKSSSEDEDNNNNNNSTIDGGAAAATNNTISSSTTTTTSINDDEDDDNHDESESVFQ